MPKRGFNDPDSDYEGGRAARRLHEFEALRGVGELVETSDSDSEVDDEVHEEDDSSTQNADAIAVDECGCEVVLAEAIEDAAEDAADETEETDAERCVTPRTPEDETSADEITDPKKRDL